MSELDSRFAAAVAASKQLSERPANADLLRLYALYKQATQGDLSDSESERPGVTDFIARAKYDAWAALAGKSAAEAMTAYIELVDSLQT